MLGKKWSYVLGKKWLRLGKSVRVCAWKKVGVLGKKWSRLEKSGRAWKIMVNYFAGPPGRRKPPINNNFSALKGHPSGNTASEYRTYSLPTWEKVVVLGKKWSCLEKSGRAWKKVVVLEKKVVISW